MVVRPFPINLTGYMYSELVTDSLVYYSIGFTELA